MSESRPLAFNAPVVGADTTAAFQDFFDGEKDRLYRVMCLVTRNRHEAEELTQDAFVRVFARWDQVSRMEDPRSYLHRTAMNAIRSRYRRALLSTKRTLRVTPPDDEMAAVDARDATVRALAALSSRQRAAVVLTDLLGYPFEEAAQMLGIRASTLRTHAARAHATLKETMPHE